MPTIGSGLEGFRASYAARREVIEEYFDRTAMETWSAITSDKPVGYIRRTVRSGRRRMRMLMLSYLPADATGLRVLDAGCGTGALAVEAARRGADVVAVDLSPRLVKLAQERAAVELGTHRIRFRVGDMLEPVGERFDWVIAMDSLIHYPLEQMVELVLGLSEAAQQGMVFSFAPRTPLLSLMHGVGKAFPRQHRSPHLEPVAASALRAALGQDPRGMALRAGRSERVDSGFYTSQTQELLR